MRGQNAGFGRWQNHNIPPRHQTVNHIFIRPSPSQETMTHYEYREAPLGYRTPLPPVGARIPNVEGDRSVP